MEVTAKCLALVDSRDKLLKGAGAAATLVSVASRNELWLQLAAATSDARGLVRLVSWLSNIQAMMNVMKKDTYGLRDLIYMCRVLTEGIFKVADNIAYIGFKSRFNSDFCKQSRQLSRQFLFWSYLSVVVLNIYDIVYDRYLKKSKKQWITLLQNTCDLLTTFSGSGYTSVKLNVATASALGLLSASIGSYECFRLAAQKSE